jgi:hypothetical protein
MFDLRLFPRISNFFRLNHGSFFVSFICSPNFLARDVFHHFLKIPGLFFSQLKLRYFFDSQTDSPVFNEDL